MRQFFSLWTDKLVKAFLFCNILLISFAFPPLPASAQDFMTGEQFEAFTTGKTFFYSKRGVAYGAEQYFENRRTMWALEGGHCSRGEWYSVGTLICFEYDSGDPASCWRFYSVSNRLFAVLDGEPPEDALEATQVTNDPLACVPAGLGA